MGGTKYSEQEAEKAVKADGATYDGLAWMAAYMSETDPDAKQQLLSQREDALKALQQEADVTAPLAWVAGERARLLAR